MRRAGIILVFYNQKENIELLYSSLDLQTYKNFTIYFVDNNNHNDDVNFSKEINSKFNLDIRYIKSGGNLGFAGGNNVGALASINDGCDYTFFLNNDNELEPRCIEGLVSLMESDENIGVASGLILYGTSRENYPIIQEFGANVDIKKYNIVKLFEGKRYNEFKDEFPENMSVDLVSGGATFVKNSLLKKTNLWEEDYFAYGDEIDFAKRVKESGLKTYVTSKAILWHNHKWTYDNKNGFYFEYYLIQRNKYLYFYKYKLIGSLVRMLFIDIIKIPARLLWFKKICNWTLGWYYIKGTAAGLLNKKGKPKLSFIK